MTLPPFDVLQPFAGEDRHIKEVADLLRVGCWRGVGWGAEKFLQKGISRLHKHSAGGRGALTVPALRLLIRVQTSSLNGNHSPPTSPPVVQWGSRRSRMCWFAALLLAGLTV